jgi:polygalacturonase
MATHFFKAFILSTLVASTFSCRMQDKRLHNLYQDVPFTMPVVQEPSIPSYEVVLTDFGAVGDGVTLCTEAFEKAFAALEAHGGGRLMVPDGVWFTGPIGLRSHTELHLSDNAIIFFSAHQDFYPIIETSF